MPRTKKPFHNPKALVKAGFHWPISTHKQRQNISIKTYASAVLCLWLRLLHPRSDLTQMWHKHSIGITRTEHVRSSCAYVVGVLTCFLAGYAYA